MDTAFVLSHSSSQLVYWGNKCKHSFNASSNSQKNSLNRNSYKWSEISTTVNDSNEMNAFKADEKYENILIQIKREMIGLFPVHNELKLNENDANESDNRQNENDIFCRDLISQSNTQLIAFVSNEMND